MKRQKREPEAPQVRVNPDSRHRIWGSLLKAMAQRQGERKGEGVTAAELAEDVGLPYPSTLQVLRRLRAWGYVRVVGFNPPEGGRGRSRHVFEVTAKGIKRGEWDSSQRRRRHKD